MYSLAIIAYELLLRRLPFDANDDFDMVLAHIQQPPRRPSQVNPNFALPLEMVLMKGLQKDPTWRYASAGSFYAALEDAVAMLDEDEQTAVYCYT